jgi:hypothetical protein
LLLTLIFLSILVPGLEFYGLFSMKGLLSLVLASAVGQAVAVPLETPPILSKRQNLGSLAGLGGLIQLFGAKGSGSGPPSPLGALLAAQSAGTLGKFVGEPEASGLI